MNMAELAVLIRREAEEQFEASVKCNGHLVFSRPGLRIFEMPDGSHRIFEAAGYDGPSPEAYVEVMRERQLEEALVDSYLEMTAEERRQRAAQGDAILDSVDPRIRTGLFRDERPTQRVSNAPRPTKARWPTTPARPTTRATKR